MLFILSKALYFLIQPLNWVVGAFVAGFITRNPRRRKQFVVGGTVMLFALTNPLLLSVALRLWEPNLVSIESISEPFDIGIVLGGYSRIVQGHPDRVHLGTHPNRLIHAVQLFKAGKIKKILLSGGSPEIIGEKLTDVAAVRDFLEEVGIPAGDIVTEARSRNTHENANYSAEIIRSRYPGARCLVITSAIHVRRAAACFRMEGLDVSVFPTDTRVDSLMPLKPGKLIVPAAGAFVEWESLVREWAGLLVYKLRGWI